MYGFFVDEIDWAAEQALKFVLHLYVTAQAVYDAWRERHQYVNIAVRSEISPQGTAEYRQFNDVVPVTEVG
jgi:hypothetical protein